MNLLKRESSYYFRISIPIYLHDYTRRKELWLSLKTTDKAKAQYKASTISFAFKKKFINLSDYIADITSMSQISYIEIKNLVEEDLNKSLLDIKRTLETLGPLNNAQLKRHEEYIQLLRGQYNDDNLPEDEYSELVENFCVSKGITPNHRERKLIQHELIKALVAQEKAKILISQELDKEPEINITGQQVALAQEITLSNLINKFKDEHISGGIWNSKSIYEVEHKLAVLLEIIGDIPVRKIGPEQALNFKEILAKLPIHASKKPEYRNLPISEILKLPRPQQTLSVTTMNKYIMWATALFNWARGNGFIVQNYFENKQYKETRKKASEFRSRFAVNEIEKLFIDWKNHKKEWQQWIPLILLYTGARVNEIASLYAEDLKEIEGVWVFDINDHKEDKRLKNLSSRRIIPVHSKLIELGLLDLLTATKHTRLWPELPYGRDGYGRNVSRWFNEHHKLSLGITDKTKTAHSFRHTFADELKQNRVPESLAASILGHASNGISYDRYGKSYIVENLKPVIEQLEFPIN